MSEDRRHLPPEDEERGRYTEGDYGAGGAVAEEGEPRPGEDDYTAGEYPADGGSARENEPAGNDPDIAVRPPDE
ncbi:hypothetical protein [Arthrobacter celericrescens]|uniref:hypothetical protein n=1 Tax=Arthrobacter celericrescens TaxID=2320851 RepID=UPI000EA250AA|nr:hypothetical protein [Arthrobacter celericrescens]